MGRMVSFGHVREVDTAARRVRAIISTSDLARDGAIIETSGWRFENYDRNPVVLWDHDRSRPPIARAVPTERVVTEREVIDVHEFAQHAQAQLVWELVRDGFVNALSVSWRPGKTEVRRLNGQEVLVFTDGHELLEVSYVTVGADPGALVLRADGATVPQMLEELARQSACREEGAATARAVRRIREVAEALRALEVTHD